MSQDLSEENLIRNYILGYLSEDERNVVAERLLSDQELYEILLIIEEDLLEDYAMELLSESDRMRLESGSLMSAQQQSSVQLIRLLHRKSNESRSVDKRLTYLLSLLNGYFSLRRNVALAVCTV